MKSKTVFLIGFILSLIVIYVWSNQIEKGDANAISMYFVVFALPTLVIAILNAICIRTLNNIKSKPVRALLAAVPIIILGILSLFKSLTISGIDGNLTFVTTVTAIALGLSNLCWMLSLIKQKSH